MLLLRDHSSFWLAVQALMSCDVCLLLFLSDWTSQAMCCTQSGLSRDDWVLNARLKYFYLNNQPLAIISFFSFKLDSEARLGIRERFVFRKPAPGIIGKASVRTGEFTKPV